jgi:predicted dienelactone hydrolase
VAGDSGRYPVVVFTPSWGGVRSDNTIQAEELASHGFVVVGVDHPYSSDRVVFPDGRVALSALTQFLDYASEETLAATERAAEEQLRIRVADVRFVLDELERLDRSDPAGLLTARLDTSKVGFFGHSFGGAVSAEVCRADPRVLTGADLDGLIFGEPRRTGFGKPFLIFSDDTRIPPAAEIESLKPVPRRRWSYIAENDRAMRRGLAQVNGYFAVLRGSRHANFCDSPYYSPFRRLRPVNDSEPGPIRHERAMKILNAYLLSLFRRHLKGEEDGLLDSPTPYDEVEITRIIREP